MGLSMPVALVVKNGGLLCQMLVGFAVLRERYSALQLVSAVAVSAGIMLTVASSSRRSSSAQGRDASAPAMVVAAVAVMLLAMLARALGRMASQYAFKAHGKQYD